MTTAPLDIRPDNLWRVKATLRKYVPDGTKAYAFGSRAKWTAKEFSDLDICLKGPERLPSKIINAIAEELEDSDLPYKVDVIDWHAISPSFQQAIEKDLVEIDLAEWDKLRLASLTSKIGSGATPRGGKDNYTTSGDIVLMRSQNVHNDGFKTDGLAFISQKQADDLSNVIVEAGDTLLNITGDSVARVCLAPSGYNARVNQHVAIIRPNPEILDNRFLRYHMVSPAMQQYMLGYAASGATRNALTKGMIENFEVPVPPLHEQKAIAKILGTLDDKIDLNRRMNETLEAMARAIFKDWFVDFGPTRAKMEGREPYLAPELWALFPDSLGEDGLPVGWKEIPLEQVMTIHDSKRIPLSSPERAKRQGEYPYYGATSIMDYVDDYLFDGIHLLVGEDGSVVKPDGKPFTQYVWGKIWVNNHAHILQGNNISTEHLYCFFESIDIAPYINGAVQQKLNQANMKRIPFIFAIQQINNEFGEALSSLFSIIRHNHDTSLQLAKTREMLLPKLMTGEVRVKGKAA